MWPVSSVFYACFLHVLCFIHVFFESHLVFTRVLKCCLHPHNLKVLGLFPFGIRTLVLWIFACKTYASMCFLWCACLWIGLLVCTHGKDICSLVRRVCPNSSQSDSALSHYHQQHESFTAHNLVFTYHFWSVAALQSSVLFLVFPFCRRGN